MHQILEDQGLNEDELCSYRQLLVVQGNRMHPLDVKKRTVSSLFTSLTVTAGDAARSALSVSHETNPSI